VEIAPFTLGDGPHLLPAARRAEIRRAASAAGIAITGLHYLLLAPAGLSITSADAAQRARTVDVMRRFCGLASDQCFAAVAEAAAGAGIIYCIEPLAPPENELLTTVEEAAAVVRAIDNPAVRTMIDCSAAGRAEAQAIPDLIRRWLPTGLIGHVHLNDPNRRGPGEGELAFAPILAALAEAGYAGMAAVEPFIYEPDGPSCAARAIGYVRGAMEGRRDAAYR
jgi:sugar phosphate isomerase/epimerase